MLLRLQLDRSVGLGDVLGGDEGDGGQVLGPEPRHHVVVLLGGLVVAAPQGVEEGVQVFGGDADLETHLADAVAEEAEGEAFTEAVLAGVDDLAVHPQLGAIDDHRQHRPLLEVRDHQGLQLLEEAPGDGILDAVGAGRAPGLVEIAEDRLGRVDLGLTLGGRRRQVAVGQRLGHRRPTV